MSAALMTRLSAGALLVIVLMALMAPRISSYDPDAVDLDGLRESPGLRHVFGTDQKGRDIFTRILYGGRVSIGAALAAALASMSVGMAIGLVSGYFGGRTDLVLMGLVDFVLSFPSLLLAIAISVVLEPGVVSVVIAISAVGWASFARLIRGYVLKLREMPYVEAARAAGCGPFRVMVVHLLPQCVPVALVMMGLKVGGYIITEASLGFLGLGVQPPVSSWGAMISSGMSYILVAPWMTIFPGLAITVTALGFNVLGEALSDRAGVRRERV